MHQNSRTIAMFAAIAFLLMSYPFALADVGQVPPPTREWSPTDLGSGVAQMSEETVADLPEDIAPESGDSPFSSAHFALNYTNIFYGPSVQSPTSYQPASNGDVDLSRPVFMKNFLSGSYALSENVGITATAYWLYRPVLGQQLIMQDPSLRVSHAGWLKTNWGLNLYSDARVHFGVTSASRESDMITAFQNFNLLSWEVAQSRLTLGLRSSERFNVYGRQGEGVDFELYLAPEASYRLTSTVALTLLYEMGSSHLYGDRMTRFTNDGTDLEPGVSWDITPNLMVNPYLNLHTGGKITMASTSFGMFLNWTIL